MEKQLQIKHCVKSELQATNRDSPTCAPATVSTVKTISKMPAVYISSIPGLEQEGLEFLSDRLGIRREKGNSL